MKKSLLEMFNDLKDDYRKHVDVKPYTFDVICTNTLQYLQDHKGDNIDIKSYYDAIEKEILNTKTHLKRSLNLTSIAAEAEVYIKLSKNLKHIEKIPETDTSTPDFMCIIKDTDDNDIVFYIELKTFDFSNNVTALQEMAIDDLDTSIEMHEILKEKLEMVRPEDSETTHVVMAEREVAPFGAHSRDVQEPILTTIEKLTDKAKTLFKEKQFQLGLTIPMYNLSTLPLSILRKQDICPLFTDTGKGKLSTIRSGILWNIVFGEQNHNIYGYHDFEGNSNLEGKKINTMVLSQKMLFHYKITLNNMRSLHVFSITERLIVKTIF